MRLLGAVGALVVVAAYAIAAFRFVPGLGPELTLAIAIGLTLLALAAAAGATRGMWSVVVLDAGLALWAAQLWLQLAIGADRVPWDHRIAIVVTGAGAVLLGIQHRTPILSASGALLTAGLVGPDLLTLAGLDVETWRPWLRELGYVGMALFGLALVTAPGRR